MTVAIPRSRRVLKQGTLPSHEVKISVVRNQRSEDWRRLAQRVSPLAVLPAVRDDVWAIHRASTLSKDFLTAVLQLRHNEPARARLMAVTGKCGNRDVLAGWLRCYRIHDRRNQPRDGGAFAVDTARSVLTAINRDDLAMADQLLIGVLSAAPHSAFLRVLEVWLAAERGELDAEDAKFALVALPTNDPKANKLVRVLLSQGPIVGTRRGRLAARILRKMG